MVQRITIAPQGRNFSLCDGVLAPDGLEYVRAPASQLY